MTTELSASTNSINNARSTEIAETTVSNVTEQIAEHDTAISKAEIEIVNLKEAIRAERNKISLHKAEKQRLRKKKRIYARAAFELKQIDEDL